MVPQPHREGGRLPERQAHRQVPNVQPLLGEDLRRVALPGCRRRKVNFLRQRRKQSCASKAEQQL